MQEFCFPLSPPFLPLATAWFLLASLLASFIICSLWQKCSTTLSCSIMNGHIWSCKYLHLWAHPGKRYKKRDLSKWQPGDQVDHTHPFAVPLPCLPGTTPKRKKVTKSCISFSAISSQFSKLLQERSQESYIRCAQLICMHLSLSPFTASGQQQAFWGCNLCNFKVGGAQSRSDESLFP